MLFWYRGNGVIKGVMLFGLKEEKLWAEGIDSELIGI